MANGHEAERVVLEGLKARGFRLAELSPEDVQRLDTLYKLDGVVLAPPMAGCFFPPPIGLQITTRGTDWPKRAECVSAVRHTGLFRLAYVELPNEPINAEHVNAVVSALQALFFGGPEMPETALVAIVPNSYTIYDLSAALARYRLWLIARIPGAILGTITYWDETRRYGFINAHVPDLDVPEANPSFFFHLSRVIDPALRSKLDSNPDATVGTLVEFEEGDPPEDSLWRKNAVRVRLGGGQTV